jgi:hypothetical protein
MQEGCDCEYTMGKTLELAKHAYGKLARAHLHYTSRGLEVPFNWDGAVHQALGTIDEYEGNAVGMLWNWWRYLDNKKDSDIMSSVITRKVQKLKAQAIGTAQYESPDAFLYE